MRAVGYARVSSAGQRDRHTIDSQLTAIPDFVQRQGWTLVAPIYVDDGLSATGGRLAARVGLAALLRDAALKQFDVVVMVNIDRLTRSEDIAERGALLGAFQRAGVQLADAITGQVLDLTTSSGDLFSAMHAFFAAEESRKRKERSARGCEAAARRGRKAFGRAPYGLVYNRSSGAWALDEVAAPIVREIFSRVADGESCSQIALDLEQRGVRRPRGLWRRNRVQEIVRARYPIGEIVLHGPKQISGSVPPIVDVDLWQRAQDVLAVHRRSGLRRTRHVYLLEGLASCGACGAPMHVRSADGANGVRTRVASYVCSQRRGMRLGARCPGPYVPVPDVDERVWNVVCRELQDPDLVPAIAAVRAERSQNQEAWQTDASQHEKHLARLDRAETALIARFTSGLVTDGALDTALEDLRRRRVVVRAQLDTATRANRIAGQAQQRIDTAAEMITKLRARLAIASPGVRREIVQLLVEHGSVSFRGHEVRFNLVIQRSASGLSGPKLGSDSGTIAPLRIKLVA